MLLSDNNLYSSSPPPMTSNWENSSHQMPYKKRKREPTLGDESITDSLTALSAFHSIHSLQTPPPSSQTSCAEFPSTEHPPKTTILSFHSHGEQPLSKRVQLAPRPRLLSRPTNLSSTSSFTQASVGQAPISPCHVCHRRPTTMSDLPTYADCESCRMRTCFVCIRTCEGPRCQPSLPLGGDADETDHRMPQQHAGRNVCARCSVEVGREGRIWCLACYENDDEPEVFSVGKTKKELQEESVGRIADWLSGCG